MRDSKRQHSDEPADSDHVGNSEKHQGRLTNALSKAQRFCTLVAWLAVAALALRFLVRDRFFPFNYNFYIPPIISGGVAMVFALFAHSRARLITIGALMVAGIPNIMIDQPRLFSRTADENASADFNVLSYNVKSYSFGANKVVPYIAEMRPDVLCLVEGTFRGRAPDNVKKALGSDYNWAVGRTVSIASRFPVVESRQIVDVREVKVLRAVLATPKGRIAVYDVDVQTPGFRDDRKAFDELYAAIADEELPAILAGDFNVPRGSYHLNRATKGWVDSFAESSTDRYLATWRHRPIALWQIDHQFHTPQLEAVSADIGTSLASDHFPLIVKYKMQQ